jgi:hypothetical protein
MSSGSILSPNGCNTGAREGARRAREWEGCQDGGRHALHCARNGVVVVVVVVVVVTTTTTTTTTTTILYIFYIIYNNIYNI